MRSRDSDLDAYRSGTLKTKQVAPSEQKILVLHDAAIVSVRVQVTGTCGPFIYNQLKSPPMEGLESIQQMRLGALSRALVCKPHYCNRARSECANTNHHRLQHYCSGSSQHSAADHQACFNDLLCRHRILRHDAMSRSAPNKVPKPIALETPKSIIPFVTGDAEA